MALPRLTSAEAVERALDEFDELGQAAFLAKYGYGEAKRYLLERDGKQYDSKAIYGVALGHQYPERGHVRNNEFSGGDGMVVPSLRELGFHVRDTHAESTSELVLPQIEVDRFAAQLDEPEYLQDERDYKLAVHEVVSRLLSAETLESSAFPELLSAFFERRLDFAALGIEGELRERIEVAVAPTHGLTNAFINLGGGRYAVNNFIWIPEAIRLGLGTEIRDAFAQLVHGERSLAERVETFRADLYALEQRSQEMGGFRPEWNLVRIQLAFVAALLGAFDPSRYGFYHRGKLERSYKELVGPWPQQNGGPLYETVCTFIDHVRAALVGQGAPVRDLIDAQSFLYLRAAAAETAEAEAQAGADQAPVAPARHGRDDIAAARGVFQAVVPSEHQQRVAELLAELTELAEQTRSGCWTLNLFPNRVVLLVGNCYVASFTPAGAYFTLDTRQLESAREAEIESLSVRAGDPGHWRSAPTFRSFDFAWATVEQAVALVDAPLRDAVADLATRYRRSPFVEAYSVGLVQLLSELTGRTLPELDLPEIVQPGSAWIFQANPAMYAIDRALRERDSIEWTVSTHLDAVHTGDRVYTLRSGQNAAIVAVGSVLNEPVEAEPAEDERPYYLQPDRFEGSRPRVSVQSDYVLDQPLSRTDLAAHEVLSQMNVIRQPRGTTFRLTPEQDEALQAMLGLPLTVATDTADRYFVLQQRPSSSYGLDNEGSLYHFTPNSSGAWKQLSLSPGARFVYYRPKSGGGDLAMTFYGAGRISTIDEKEEDDGRHFLASVQGYVPFARPVPAKEFDPRPNVQMSISEISRDQYDELLERAAGQQDAPVEPYVEPSFEDVLQAILRAGLALSARTIRRYHLSLRSRGFVVLSGVSGTGKTWLAQTYATAMGANQIVVPVAPNWTTNEDLLGYLSPITNTYRDTPFSRFLRAASAEWESAKRADREPRPFHVILDEMNLARVEYYFAHFLSVMELRARDGEASIELAPNDSVTLGGNLKFIGTVNIDETTHLFADKVFDRAQLVELDIDRASLERHLGTAPHAEIVLELFDAVGSVAPFGYRTVDEIASYIRGADALDVPWQEALDEQIFQKVLPKLKGADPRIGTALEQLIQLTAAAFPLSNAKAQTMQEGLVQHGFSSYF